MIDMLPTELKLDCPFGRYMIKSKPYSWTLTTISPPPLWIFRPSYIPGTSRQGVEMLVATGVTKFLIYPIYLGTSTSTQV